MNEQNPSPASTVVLASLTKKWPYKILLLKRNSKANFLPDFHVFPGGRVDKADCHFAKFLAKDQKNFDRIKQFFPKNYPEIFSHVSAAIRETFEESGISLLKQWDSRALSGLLDGGFEDLPPGLIPRLDNIWPISWWITPRGETRRFNTWFFLAGISQEQCPYVSTHSNSETSEPLWLTPKDALDRYSTKKIKLAPPTRSILERMAASQSLTDFLSHVDQPIVPINPYFAEDESKRKILVLPGDILHHEEKLSNFAMHTRYAFP